MQASKKPNRLINEKSPYLLQHAFNPVDWYPWGEEAFARARNEDKPIFLSIGYSTCHWCHVMEEESFENEAIAAFLNQHFVCIKVDREERPDVDRVYMTALQSMGQNGGWPMSMFLTPDLKPFFGGTYFPPESRYGRVGFADLLKRLHELWINEREKVLDAAHGVITYLQQLSTVTSPQKLSPNVLDECFEQFSKMYDPTHGGFGGAPKFPRPVVFHFLLRCHRRTGSPEARAMLEKTLTAMATGGMYDHIGGGFHRYAVDAQWRIPHFEKMLYDQAQLIVSYIGAYQLTWKEAYGRIARDVAEYVLRELRDPRGGFYSAEDADSPRPELPNEKGEGAFYVWTMKEIREVLEKDLADIFCFRYGVEEQGNVPVDPQLEFSGRNILYIARSIAETANAFNKTEQEVDRLLDTARKRLFEARLRRPKPQLDDKILAGWNGLMISALACAYQMFNDRRYLSAAQAAAMFLLQHMHNPATGKLYRRYREGEARFDAHLDDYAFVVAALLDLYESDFDPQWLEQAIRLATVQQELFWDEDQGGFFETGGEDSSVLVRIKEHYDGAEPAGNSVAAWNMLRLYHISGNADWRRRAEQTFEAFASILNKQPAVLPYMACAYDCAIRKVKQVVIAGKMTDSLTREMMRCVYRAALPPRVLILLDPLSRDRIERIAPFTRQLTSPASSAVAYICEDNVCRLPTTELAEVEQLLSE